MITELIPEVAPETRITMNEMAGWYYYDDMHRIMLTDAPKGARFIEVGVFIGKSIVGLAQLADAMEKDIRIVGVDWFMGSPEFDQGHPVLINNKPFNESPTGVLAQLAIAQLYYHDVMDRTQLIVSDSAKAAEFFPDGSCWAVVLDAGHDEASLTRDIAAWWPKVAPGGWLGGDDFGPGFPSVMRAVQKNLPGAMANMCHNWWIIQKPEIAK